MGDSALSSLTDIPGLADRQTWLSQVRRKNTSQMRALFCQRDEGLTRELSGDQTELGLMTPGLRQLWVL